MNFAVHVDCKECDERLELVTYPPGQMRRRWLSRLEVTKIGCRGRFRYQRVSISAWLSNS